jgi:hypothetical protein
MSIPGPPDRRVRERWEQPTADTDPGVTMPRFLTMIRIDERSGPQGPSPELMERMGELLTEITEAGVMLETAGLTPTSDGARITWSGGAISRVDGPFTEAKEVIGGYSIVRAKDKDEALYWAERFLRVHEDYWTITCEVREIVEMEDPGRDCG